MTGQRFGAHWVALLHEPEFWQSPDATILENALGTASAVAWEWDILTSDRAISDGAHNLMRLQHDPTGAWINLIHPADRERIRTAVSEAASGARRYDVEFRLLRPDGLCEWVRDRGHLERGPGGIPSRLAGVAQVITEQKRTEAGYRATFEQAAVGMAHVSPDGAIIRINDCLCRMLGRPAEVLLSLGFQDITHPDDLDTDIFQMGRLLAGEIATYSMEKRYFRGDGAIVWGELTVSLVSDRQGHADFLIAVVQDIGPRKALEARAHADAVMRGLMERSPDCLKVLDADGRIVMVNAAGCRAVGVDGPDMLVGQPWEHLWPADERRHVQQALQTARSGKLGRFVGHRVSSSGDRRIWDCVLWSLPDGDGRLMAMSRDSSEIWPPAPHGVPIAATSLEGRTRWDNAANNDFACSALQATVDCILVLEEDGRVVSVNKAGLAQMEVDQREQVCGRDVVLLWPRRSREAVARAIRLARIGEATRLTAYGPTARGTPRWWDVVVSPLLKVGDLPPRLLLVARDVTETSVMASTLRASLAGLHAFIDGMPQMAFVINGDGAGEQWNRRWCDYTGLPQDEPLHSAWAKAVHPDDRPLTWYPWLASLSSGKAYETEHRIRAADNTYGWFLTRAAPLRGVDEARPTVWFGTSTDISDLVARRAER